MVKYETAAFFSRYYLSSTVNSEIKLANTNDFWIQTMGKE